jgi:hypothetical protein
MKNIKLFISILLFSACWAYALPAIAQSTPKQKDTVEIMSTPSGADATGPVAINKAHGKPLDNNGVIVPKKVTYTYLKKDSPEKDTVTTIPADSSKQSAVTTVVVPDSIDNTHQNTAVTTGVVENDHCCGYWGWLGLLGLLGLFGLKKQRKSD